MAYFTILHWFALLILLVVFILFSVIALKQTNRKLILPMLFSNFLVVCLLAISSMFIIDKYTKVAKLENVTQERVLITEAFTLRGQIRNTGNFNIGRCKLKVKLVNNAMTGGGVTGAQVFSPSGFSFFARKKNERPSTIINEFIIAKNFRKGELKNFSVSMPFPPYFKNPFMNYKLYCR